MQLWIIRYWWYKKHDYCRIHSGVRAFLNIQTCYYSEAFPRHLKVGGFAFPSCSSFLD
ncbi:Orf149 [Heliothis zea nudivirus]|uniref:Orf149 n=1 Tax=Heliothis zea nudivirus 1 TaxID=3116536 RepID=Q8JKG4_9VIRU|nr:Orf149 [Heliothis zea nudivirus]AAN04441.1 Orf149 [Heliothis zea nudivirus]